MRELERVSQELDLLQIALQATVNRLWKLKFSLNSAFHLGNSERDFLPRRILSLSRAEQRHFDELLHRLRSLLDSNLSNPLRATHAGDQVALAQIHRTMRYLKNAYCSEPPVLHALARIGRALPARAAH